MTARQMTNCPQIVMQNRPGVPGPGTSKGSSAVASGVSRAGTEAGRSQKAGLRRWNAGRAEGNQKIRGEGEGCTPSDRPSPAQACRAGTAVPSVRKVVFGHAYAIPAPPALAGGPCGKCKPAKLPVDGSETQKPWAPVLRHRGPLDVESAMGHAFIADVLHSGLALLQCLQRTVLLQVAGSGSWSVCVPPWPCSRQYSRKNRCGLAPRCPASTPATATRPRTASPSEPVA